MIDYIDQSHFDNPSEKLTDKWMSKMIKNFYYQGGAISLLHGKDIVRIRQFATGNHDMSKLRRLYQKRKKKLPSDMKGVSGDFNSGDVELDFEPLGLLVSTLNSAIATITKQSIDVKATAIDTSALKEKRRVKDMLKNRVAIMEDLDGIAAKMGMPVFDIGGIDNGLDYETMPDGFDPESEEDQAAFLKMFYKFGPEAAVEDLMTSYSGIKDIQLYHELEVRDTFYWGVCSHRTSLNQSTGLPDYIYLNPKDVYVERGCQLPDKSDTPFVYCDQFMTISELFSSFGEEINSEETLQQLINLWTKATGVQLPTYQSREWWQSRVWITYWEFKSVDCISIRTVVNRFGQISYDFGKGKQVWGQNTYCGYWLPGSPVVFNKERLATGERKKGQEYISPFSFHIWESQDKGAAELCIPEVINAQDAYIKLQHCIRKSLPPGRYVDMKYMREAAENLKESGTGLTVERLLELFLVDNFLIGDTEGMTGNEANQQPFSNIPGGLGNEADGYWKTIEIAKKNIADLTGVNQQVTGQQSNPEGLVGLQKLLINASINSIHYASIAKKAQLQKMYVSWSSMCIAILKGGGKPKQMLVNLVGPLKADLLEKLDGVILHNYSIIVKVTPREEEKQILQQMAEFALKQNIITGADLYMINELPPKDAVMYLFVKEKAKLREVRQMEEARNNAMMQAQQQKTQGEMQMKQMDGQIEIQKIQGKGEVDAKLMQLAHTLGISKEQVSGMVKRDLQDRRAISQLQKSMMTIREQANMKAQNPTL